MSETRFVERNEDMSPRGRLRVMIQEDGDAIIAVIPDPDEGRFLPSAEFCTHAGGGRSKHTREAIYALYKAMERDNEERPLMARNEDPVEPLRESTLAALKAQRDQLQSRLDAAVEACRFVETGITQVESRKMGDVGLARVSLNARPLIKAVLAANPAPSLAAENRRLREACQTLLSTPWTRQ